MKLHLYIVIVNQHELPSFDEFSNLLSKSPHLRLLNIHYDEYFPVLTEITFKLMKIVIISR